MNERSSSSQRGSALLFTVFLLVQLMLCAILIHKKYCRSMELVTEYIQKAQQELWYESWLNWAVVMLKQQFKEWRHFLEGQPKKTLKLHIEAGKTIRYSAALVCELTAVNPTTIKISLNDGNGENHYFQYCLTRIAQDDEATFKLSRSA
jgi:hypothetical protein